MNAQVSTIIAIVAGLAIMGIAATFLMGNSKDTSVNSYVNERQQLVDQQPATSSTGAVMDEKSYSMTEVQAHATDQDCFAAINGNVYDLTSWIPRHPGGPQRIIRLCGKNGSDDFNGRHGEDARALQMLATFKIGVLAQ